MSCRLTLTEIFSNKRILKVGTIKINKKFRKKQRTRFARLEWSYRKIVILRISYVL